MTLKVGDELWFDGVNYCVTDIFVVEDDTYVELVGPQGTMTLYIGDLY